MLELYHNDMSTCAQKVRVALGEKNLEWSGHELNLRTGDQHRPEFLRLNPKGVVPVLVHDRHVIPESTIIMEYLEEAFPGTKALMPTNPASRAVVRSWLQRLDAGLHLQIAVISIGIAFRDQLIAVHNTAAALESYYAAVPDPGLRAVYRDVIPLGTKAPTFQAALNAWKQLLADMSAALQSSEWLVGAAETLADAAYIPYLCRLEHLTLTDMWSAYPKVAAWYARMKQTDGYRRGIEAWLNPKYLELMSERGASARNALAQVA
jgi:glutathione S-transferase